MCVYVCVRVCVCTYSHMYLEVIAYLYIKVHVFSCISNHLSIYLSRLPSISLSFLFFYLFDMYTYANLYRRRC